MGIEEKNDFTCFFPPFLSILLLFETIVYFEVYVDDEVAFRRSFGTPIESEYV